MDRVINVALLKEPLNWIIVALMVAIAAWALALILGHDGKGFITATGSSGVSDSQPASPFDGF